MHVYIHIYTHINIKYIYIYVYVPLSYTNLPSTRAVPDAQLSSKDWGVGACLGNSLIVLGGYGVLRMATYGGFPSITEHGW